MECNRMYNVFIGLTENQSHFTKSISSLFGYAQRIRNEAHTKPSERASGEMARKRNQSKKIHQMIPICK